MTAPQQDGGASAEPVLVSEQHVAVRVLRLNRPEARNALNAETLRDTRPVHPHHVSAEFAQQHRGKRTGPDSGELHYPDPGERPVKGRRH